MARIKVWVKVEDYREAVGISVMNDADIDDVVQEALKVEKVNIAPGCVSVWYRGEKVQRKAKARDYTNDELSLSYQEGE